MVMSEMRLNRTKSAVGNINTQDAAELKKGASQAGVGIILTLAALLGSWGIMCLVSAVVGEGGLLGVGRSWISAITGM
jgi:hypothetical protein